MLLLVRVRSAVLLIALFLLPLLAACAPSDPPPTSPLDEETPTATPSPPATVSATATSTGTPDETSQPTVAASGTPATSAAAEAERITGEAIARLAEWSGTPQTELRLTSIEAVDWPDACLGVANPALACADVITPGYRVTLHHVSDPEVPYYVHTSKDGRYSWAPSLEPESRWVESVDAEAGTVTLEATGGEGQEDHLGRMHRVVPGSYLEVPLDALPVGQRVWIGTADPVGGEAGLIVFLVPIAE